MGQRHEPRIETRLVVTLDGRDKSGHPFTQNAVATNLSKSGALLSEITKQVRSGDLIWVAHGGKRSRFKVVWVRDSESTSTHPSRYTPAEDGALPMGKPLSAAGRMVTA